MMILQYVFVDYLLRQFHFMIHAFMDAVL